ncbi:MAG: hypothetical protein HY810_01740 [Candidatus Omnitrophica bacterium]|nr:hypothetical protein [Candidatus Omnitrophota bacterium]
MKKILILIVICGFVFCSQESYAFFGKKKKNAEPKPAEKKEQVIEEVKQQLQPKIEVKTEQKTETVNAASTPVEKPVTVSPEQMEEMTKKREAMRKKVEEKRQQINNTSWTAEVSKMGAQEKSKKDAFLFKNNKFSSDKFSKDGFNPSNYTVTVKEDNITVWETMQRTEEGMIVFWRGEVAEDFLSMRGVFSKQSSEGASEDYSFVCERKGEL